MMQGRRRGCAPLNLHILAQNGPSTNLHNTKTISATHRTEWNPTYEMYLSLNPDDAVLFLYLGTASDDDGLILVDKTQGAQIRKQPWDFSNYCSSPTSRNQNNRFFNSLF